MQFSIEAKSGVPIYLQLKDQIKYQIASGRLGPGTQMPTVRQMAVDLRVNPNTVARVYSELESEGFLMLQQGRGTYVAEEKTAGDLDELRQQKLRSLIQKCLADGVGLGFSLADIRKTIHEEMEAWEKNDAQS